MATLNDIAKKVTTLAQLNLTKGYTRAYKTGNLYNRVGAYNTPSRVLGDVNIGKKRLIKKNATDTIDLNLVYNPPGAEYGQFIEEGYTHVGGKKMPAKPFAEEAINSPIIEKMIDDYVGIYIEDNVIASIDEELSLMESEF
jgi:hypothetical protein